MVVEEEWQNASHAPTDVSHPWVNIKCSGEIKESKITILMLKK